MYTIKDINKIINGKIFDLKENKKITDFEYQMNYVRQSNTAFFSISKETWKKWLGKEPQISSGYEQIKQITHFPEVIITETYYHDLNQVIPQIVVQDTIQAMQLLGKYFRDHFSNPIIAITGSMGKSSTRLMIGEALNNHTILQNRGNANTRIPTLLNLCKLASNPDFAVFEMSLNALNNKGNLSLLVKPDISIVTGIGEAHLATIKNTEEIARFKARIFAGQNEGGKAIINADTQHANLLERLASYHVGHVITYSVNKEEDIVIEENKGFTNFNFKHGQEAISFKINTISRGMISNVLATLNLLKLLDVNIKQSVSRLSRFQPFKKVLEIKDINTPHLNTTLLDDTHNASLPAMINAIEAFNHQCRFYTGNKIIVLGKISDLGIESENIHLLLVDILQNSQADYILCIDNEMRKVVNHVKGKKITWYNDPEQLLYDLQYMINEDGLTLLKSSVTGTELPRIATRLFYKLQNNRHDLRGGQFYNHIPFSKSFFYLNENNRNIVVNSTSISIEGLTPLIYYIYSQKREIKKDNVVLNRWPTNDATYFEGKKISYPALIESMLNKPHPSLVYQLAKELFNNEKERREYIIEFIKSHRLSYSSSVNVTGRYREKERQSFSIQDLEKLYKAYDKLLFKNTNHVIFGDKYLHGIIKTKQGVLLFSMFSSLESLISEML